MPASSSLRTTSLWCSRKVVGFNPLIWDAVATCWTDKGKTEVGAADEVTPAPPTPLPSVLLGSWKPIMCPDFTCHVFQPRHYYHLGLDHSLCWHGGGGCGPVQYWMSSAIPGLSPLDTSSTPSRIPPTAQNSDQKYLQKLPDPLSHMADHSI